MARGRGYRPPFDTNARYTPRRGRFFAGEWYNPGDVLPPDLTTTRRMRAMYDSRMIDMVTEPAVAGPSPAPQSASGAEVQTAAPDGVPPPPNGETALPPEPPSTEAGPQTATEAPGAPVLATLPEGWRDLPAADVKALAAERGLDARTKAEAIAALEASHGGAA